MLQSTTEYYKVLQSVTERYRVLQSVTKYYRVLRSITKTNLAHLLGPIFGLVLLLLEGWYVEWIKITLSGGRMFICPVEKWLDSGEGALGPPTLTVDCHKSGRNVINKNKGNNSLQMSLWRNALMRRRP